MKNLSTKYTSEEILQIFIDFYNCQSQFDPEVDEGQELSFETTIADWRMICDLIPSKKLAVCYHDLFHLKTPLADLEKIFVLENKNTLREVCVFISENSEKEKIVPITSMGQICMRGGIFKTLISNLKNRGVNTSNIKPSSEIIPIFNKCGGILVEEVNKLAPGALSKFEYRDNKITRIGSSIAGISILSIMIISWIWKFHWAMLILLVLGIITIAIGKIYKPEKEIIGDYNTVRDLILGIEKQINKSTTLQ